MVRLIDLFRSGQITQSEYQSYLDLGYVSIDPVQLQTGRSAEMVTVSYMNLGDGRTWTLKSGETMFAVIMERIRGLVLKPAAVWEKIKGEENSPRRLLLGGHSAAMLS